MRISDWSSDVCSSDLTAKLRGQFEDAFRTVPDTPAMQELKFSEMTIGQNADLQDDPTINSAALLDKRDEMDSSADASGKHLLDFNDIGWWLKLLCGAPVPTGTGPSTHVFTVTLDQSLSAMLEFVIGATDRKSVV